MLLLSKRSSLSKTILAIYPNVYMHVGHSVFLLSHNSSISWLDNVSLHGKEIRRPHFEHFICSMLLSPHSSFSAVTVNNTLRHAVRETTFVPQHNQSTNHDFSKCFTHCYNGKSLINTDWLILWTLLPWQHRTPSFVGCNRYVQEIACLWLAENGAVSMGTAQVLQWTWGSNVSGCQSDGCSGHDRFTRNQSSIQLKIN